MGPLRRRLAPDDVHRSHRHGEPQAAGSDADVATEATATKPPAPGTSAAEKAAGKRCHRPAEAVGVRPGDGRPDLSTPRPGNRLETSADEPVPVRVVAQKIGHWVARLGEIWVEGQIAELGGARAFRPNSWCCATPTPTSR